MDDKAVLSAANQLEPEGWCLVWDQVDPDRMIWTLGDDHGVTLRWPGFTCAEVPQLVKLLRDVADIPGLRRG